ncbi:MAG: D-arabinono-1,4-lactone oxidase [Terracoccus sp.]
MTVTAASSAGTNWAGNHRYVAERLERPTSVEELQQLVARTPLIRALGSRHSFTDLTDTTGVLVSLEAMPTVVEVDEQARTATVSGRAAYGEVAVALEAKGWALANLASLPHISVVGAVSTGTHGSGVGNGSLATSVAALEIIGPDGELRRVARGDADFDGSVIGLGALGIVVRAELDIEPTYEVSQSLFTGISWERLEADHDAITSSAYSVSLFTMWGDEGITQAWLKSRGEAPDEFFGGEPATATMHMLAGAETEAVTQQGGVPGPWLERLPHFRMEFTPSRGEELQSEYLVPRDRAVEAVGRLRALRERMEPVLQVCELRTVKQDDLWLSSSYGHDVVGVHFTWDRDVPAVYAVLPAIEEALVPLGARPHWGKCFAMTAESVAGLYPRMGDFLALRNRVDPDRKFDNDFLRRVLG